MYSWGKSAPAVEKVGTGQSPGVFPTPAGLSLVELGNAAVKQKASFSLHRRKTRKHQPFHQRDRATHSHTGHTGVDSRNPLVFLTALLLTLRQATVRGSFMQRAISLWPNEFPALWKHGSPEAVLKPAASSSSHLSPFIDNRGSGGPCLGPGSRQGSCGASRTHLARCGCFWGSSAHNCIRLLWGEISNQILVVIKASEL